MSANTKIEWCDHTFNPWIGCTKVSPGCANCYAEAYDKRWGGSHWGKGAPRKRTSAANWNQPLKWHREEEAKRVSHAEFVSNRRPRVFCASLADWLDDEAPVQWLADLFNLIWLTPSLDWLLLTKRPENFHARIFQAWHDAQPNAMTYYGLKDWDRGTPPTNVWIGTTVEDQQRADERIPALIKIPARVRFLSCEPLLGPVYLSGTVPIPWGGGESQGGRDYSPQLDFIHWVICGGESGPNARPMHPDWARRLRDQCARANVPFFFKQWGEWLPVCEDPQNWKSVPNGFDWHRGKESTVLQLDGRQAAEHPGTQMTMIRTGKKAAGRLLDGREHNEFPA